MTMTRINSLQKSAFNAPSCGALATSSNSRPSRHQDSQGTHSRPTGNLLWLWLLLTPVPVMATMPEPPVDGRVVEIPGGNFANADLQGWSERSFKGNTEYRLEEEDGVRVLRADTRGQASILYREQTVDLASTPVVEWSWKINGTYPDINERSRSGDDFPARLYVVAKTGFLPWETVAINYVWSSQSPLDEAWANPFTDKAHMVVVQTGDEHVGDWIGQRRNVAEDFSRYFDMDISKLSGYAVMVDGDNAERDGTAWFGEIRFTAR